MKRSIIRILPLFSLALLMACSAEPTPAPCSQNAALTTLCVPPPTRYNFGQRHYATR